jgi:glycosyltransferase involved in cell wall biosynthesis
MRSIVKSESKDLPWRVIFIITGLNTGGAEMMLLKLCSQLDRRRFEPYVISLSEKGVIGPRIEALGIPVNTLGMRLGRPSLTGLLRLRKLVSTLCPNLIQGWMYHGNLAATLAAGSAPVVWGIRQSFYGLDKERMLTRWVIWLSAVMSRYPRTIVYNSRTSAQQHEKFGFDTSRTCIIPNGFDTEVLNPDKYARISIREELELSQNIVIIGLIGRYHQMKDHRNFLNAAALLVKEFSDVRFLLAGCGVDEDNPALKSMVAEFGLDGLVLMIGERNDIPQLNAALDIASSSSAWGEGFANVIGEAMSSGVPCVVPDVGDSAWIVGNAGKVVPRSDPVALAAAWKSLIQLNQTDRQALGNLARQRVIENFSLKSVVKQYEDLYESCIAKEGI